jgi:hypothetical protein
MSDTLLEAFQICFMTSSLTCNPSIAQLYDAHQQMGLRTQDSDAPKELINGYLMLEKLESTVITIN